MKVITFLFSLVIMVICCSCSVNKSDIRKFKVKFGENKNAFENLVELLKSQNLKVGYSINENELPKNIQELLENLKISDINILTTDCKDISNYQFRTSWSKNATLYFSKDHCNKQQANQEYHSKVSDMIEVWGLGDDWVMWIDYDYI
jgi:hypothetical protein